MATSIPSTIPFKATTDKILLSTFLQFDLLSKIKKPLLIFLFKLLDVLSFFNFNKLIIEIITKLIYFLSVFEISFYTEF